MDDNRKDIFQPRHPLRGTKEYRQILDEVTKRPLKQQERRRRDLWDVHLTGYQYEGDHMDESEGFYPETLIELVFKPKQFGRLLRPEESQLILAYMDEILKEAAIEEQKIIEEGKIRSGEANE